MYTSPYAGFVEDYYDLHAPILGIDECLSYGFAGEGVRLNKNLPLRDVQFPDDGDSGTTVRKEVDINGSG